MTGTSETVRYAVELTKRGYSCYPVTIELDSNGAKIPHFKWTPDSPGWKAGKYPTDPDEIAQHWDGFDGIAINTERSGIVVVDIDVKGTVDGHQGLEDAQIVLPRSPFEVRSWSGGEHRYYRAGDVPVPTSAGVLARGVDVRGVGGVIFAPPTPVGEDAYRVASGRVPSVDGLPEFPDQIARRLVKEDKATRKTRGPVIRRELVEHERKFHEQRRQIALDAIANAGDGDRRAAIIRNGIIVFSVGDLMGDDWAESEELIRIAYESSGGREWEKHTRLIRDQIEYVRENPWELPAVPAKEELPEGVAEEQREEYMKVKERKMLARIADREIREEEREREASRLALGSPRNLADLANNPPDSPLWLVDDLLHAEKMRGLVIGQAKAGKSTFVHNLLASLTSGTPFLDHYLVNREVRVAYVDLELGERLAYDWLIPLQGIRHDKVEYYDRVGQGNKLDCRVPGLRRRWAQELADLGVDILIVDPISPVISALGMSEDSSEVRGLLDSFDELANMAGMSGVIVCHHAGHSDPARGRGSSAFNDWHTARMSLMLQDGRVDLPRKFSVSGRGVAPISGAELRRDMSTGALTLDYGDAWQESDPFYAYRGEGLTLQQACEVTGLSESSTRRKLRQFGWSSDGSVGGRGQAATWHYRELDVTDPFN